MRSWKVGGLLLSKGIFIVSLRKKNTSFCVLKGFLGCINLTEKVNFFTLSTGRIAMTVLCLFLKKADFKHEKKFKSTVKVALHVIAFTSKIIYLQNSILTEVYESLHH